MKRKILEVREGPGTLLKSKAPFVLKAQPSQYGIWQPSLAYEDSLLILIHFAHLVDQ